MNRKHLFSGILLTLILLVIGCGGTSGPPLNSSQAAIAFGDVDTALADAGAAEGLARTAPISRLHAAEAAVMKKAILRGTPVSLWEDSISPDHRVSPDASLPTYTYKCSSGGTIVVTGSYSETATSASLNLIETINKCSDSGVTFSGDPNIDITDSASDNGTTTTGTLTITGGISVGSASCTINVNETLSLSDKTGSGSATVSGTFCGQSMNETETISD